MVGKGCDGKWWERGVMGMGVMGNGGKDGKWGDGIRV